MLGQGRLRVDEIQGLLADAVGDQAPAFAQMLPRCTERLVVDFGRALRARGDLAAGQPADKAFIDGLYEEE